MKEDSEIIEGVYSRVTTVNGGMTPGGRLVVALEVQEDASSRRHNLILDLDNAKLLQKTMDILIKKLDANENTGNGDVSCN